MASPFEAEVMYSERNRRLLIVADHKFGFHKELSCGAKRYKCAKRGCRAYLKIREPATVVDSNLVHNHECNPILTRHNLSYNKLDKPKPLYNTANRLKSALTSQKRSLYLKDDSTLLNNNRLEFGENVVEITRSESPEAQAGLPQSEETQPTIEPITITCSKNDSTADTSLKPLKYFIKDKPISNSFNNHRRKLLKKLIKPVSISKRSKRFTDLQTKLNIIDKSAQGLRTSDISKEYNLPWTTVDSILKNRYRYLDAAHNVSGEVRLLKARQDIFIIMEEHLMAWICSEGSNGRPLNSTEIRKMAKKIFDELKVKDPECKADFSASKGWFNRFLGRSGLKSIVRNESSCSYGDYEENQLNFLHSALPYVNYAESGFEMEGAENLLMEQIPVECVLKTNGDNQTVNSDNTATDNRFEPAVGEEEEEEGEGKVEVKVEEEDSFIDRENNSSELLKTDLEQIFKRIDEIGVIMNKDPLKNRAFMCFNAIQSACLPYKMKLEEMEQRRKREGTTRTDVDAFFREKLVKTTPTSQTPTQVMEETPQVAATGCRLDANFYAPKQLSLALTAAPTLTPTIVPYLHFTTSELTISQVPNSPTDKSPSQFIITDVKSLREES